MSPPMRFGSGGRVRAVLISGDPAMCEQLRLQLGFGDRVEVVDSVRACADGVPATRLYRPGVVVLSLRNRRGGCCRHLVRPLSLLAPVLVLIDRPDVPLVPKLLAAGARSFLVRGEYTVDELVNATTATARNIVHLSPAAATVLVDLLHARPVNVPF
ncbi:hypothetical protein [Crossiella sp. CA198]|uniref:hypothetical protein n=1 Tax=Crossiella sp. CA198 TaxID=3455607 RepID=UPI003F8D0840